MNKITEPEAPEKLDHVGSNNLDNNEIYARIFEAIVAHRLLPGTHLKEDILCDIYNVSRTRIRAVLSRLAADHVIDTLPNKGAFISHPTIEEAKEVFRARRLIEGYLVRRVAEKHVEMDRSTLQDHLQQQRIEHETGDHSVEIRSCSNFHLILADLAQSPIMAHFMYELAARSALIIAIYESQPSSMEELEEHQEMADLIISGKGNKAAELMENHLTGIENRLNLTPPKKIDDNLLWALGTPSSR